MKQCSNCEKYVCHPAFDTSEPGFECNAHPWMHCASCESDVCGVCFSKMEYQHEKELRKEYRARCREHGRTEGKRWRKKTTAYFDGGSLNIVDCGEVCKTCADEAMDAGHHLL